MSNFDKLRIMVSGALIATLAFDFYINIHLSVYLIILGIFIGVIILGSTTLSINLFTKSYTHLYDDNNFISLTFDDGPSDYTLDVLDTLKKYNVKATFFCIGIRMESNPEIVKRIVNEGHQIGNHSYSHSKIFPLLSKRRIVEEIQRTNKIILELTGINNSLFRPPFGVINPAIASAAKKTNQHTIGWNIRSFDTTLNKNKVINRIKSKIKGGSIILLHDNLKDTSDILDSILQFVNEKGFETVTLQSMIKY